MHDNFERDSTMMTTDLVLEKKPSPLLHAADKSFWHDLNPDLHITSHPFSDHALGAGMDPALVARTVARIAKDGYFSLPPIMEPEEADRLARVVRGLVQKNIPPAFGFIYDEFWQLFYRLRPLMMAMLGKGFKMMPNDIWGWHIDHTGSGWRPHRDMFSKDAVRADKRPRVVNVWIPLTDATPLNSCMYVLPAHLDPNIPDNLESATGYSAKDFHNIRAIPAEAGSALGWNTQVLHWGGKSSEWAEHPRISVAIYLHSADCNLDEIDHETSRGWFESMAVDHAFEMPFESRLRALAGAIQLYAPKVRVDFPDTHLDIFAFSKQYGQPWGSM